jgi:hypothetical protein
MAPSSCYEAPADARTSTRTLARTALFAFACAALLTASTLAHARDDSVALPVLPPSGYAIYRQTQEMYVPRNERASEPQGGTSPASPGRSRNLTEEKEEAGSSSTASPSVPDEIADWAEGDPVPAGYHAVHRLRGGLIVAGAVLFGSLYTLSALTAASVDDAGSGPAQPLYIPVVGPFFQMTNTTTETGKVIDVIDGLSQTAGLVMLMVGLTQAREALVRDRPAPSAVPVPYVSQGGAGLRVVGTF